MCGTREAVKCSLLQTKSTRITGTLRKKKKLVYSEAHWVVLCVHDDKIPCLEWYHKQESVADHNPFKVRDLLYVTYVNTVLTDNRSFIIGITDEEPIELVAVKPQDCNEWVEISNNVLRRLDILSGPSNIYEAGLNHTKVDPVTRLPSPLITDMPTPILANHRTTTDRHSADTHVSFNGVCVRPPIRPTTLRPPLPPRRYDSPFSPRRSNSADFLASSETLYNLTSPEDRQRTPQQLSPMYDTPRNELRGDLMMSPRLSRANNGDVTQSPRHRHATMPERRQTYDTLSPVTSYSNISSSPIQSTMSTNSLCSSLSSELRLSTNLHAENEYDSIRNGFHHPVKYVSLNLSVVVEHVCFVEILGRVWVAGWSAAHDKHLAPVLSLGDELIEVEGRPINGIGDIPHVFYNVSNAGTPISMMLQPIPFGTQYTLVKPINKAKSIGIILHKKKNRIEEVEVDSIAARRGVTRGTVSALKDHQASFSVITEMNGRRLNPFAKNEQFYHMLDEVRDGTEFTMVVHPHDFVKELKQQLLNVKHYKVFLSKSKFCR